MNELIRTTRENADGTDGTVIAVAGELDLTSCPTLEEVTRQALSDGAPLRLDMSGVTFMDSSGLNFLLRLRRRLAEGGSRLVLTGLREAPMRLLTLTGADAILLPADPEARGQQLNPTSRA
ncbi:STAS domain-containing protein [Streptomyces sp. NPDC056069]|uniref:STAS domain-containing protein n=1 Tax=Streptomyces sp. NPDC056069 TaxID=3345702 RepID=UPI0035E39FF9